MGSTILLRGMSLLGLAVIILICYLLSSDRRKIPWRLVAWGVGLQLALGVLVLDTRFGHTFFSMVDRAFNVLNDCTKEGSRFLFGNLVDDMSIGAIVAFQVLPVIVFVSSLSMVLLHFRVIQAVVNGMAYVLRRTMKTSGAETFAAALQVFMGIESLPASRGYLERMTRSELFVIMTTFMGTIASSVMVAYASFGAQPGHLLAASLMCAPAALLISKMLVPETGNPLTDGSERIEIPVESRNMVDAAARGASDGLQLALNVGAALIAFIGLVYLANLALKGITGISLEQAMSWLFHPFALLMGVPWHDAGAVAELLGKKTVLNEFLAYADLKPLIEQGALSPRSVTIVTYALCGFANPGSLGILLGALNNLVPDRRSEFARLGLLSLVAGTLTSFMTACVAGMLTSE
ncbi:MAG TPA: nucleoside transporter C-terminal domain-containing protein [Candidatus Hydrogenedentes bacterium]|nr:nucleoside transporter C-terminal domain-containing protein [Candidatus Hydrogenedentota bacterium]HOV74643.1 nucleoside transporter C-terminal domain-containing protein [Candidatus Hydrogenedentota bacterium]HPC15571.1 nucleoside transporter C-terminal domain-containing protein [Candidatus Hydrogenedentota bacterium]HRT19391.1 nucleoside transporter C-terminal domain-containing protein [Candidatus Hydrogenedentota bacterium]HRT63875.1 nucleoside transporter C-terminal domain-containing prot